MKSASELQGQLDPLVDELGDYLGDGLKGVYVFGSEVIGNGDEYSDIDTCVITQERMFEDEGKGRAAEIVDMHHRLSTVSPPLAALETLYLATDQLDFHDVGSRFLFVEPSEDGPRGQVQPLRACTPIVTDAIREQGVAIYGPPAEAVFPAAASRPLQNFVRYMFAESGLYQPAEADESDGEVALRLVELLRLYYTHIEQAPVTKQGVMAWFGERYPSLAASSAPEVERARSALAVNRERLCAGLLSVMHLKHELIQVET